MHNHTCKFNHSPSATLYPIIKSQITKVNNRNYLTQSHMQIQVFPSVILYLNERQITKVNSRKCLAQSHMQIQPLPKCYASPHYQMPASKGLQQKVPYTLTVTHANSSAFPLLQCTQLPESQHYSDMIPTSHLLSCMNAVQSVTPDVHCAWRHHSPASPKRLISATSSFSKQMRRLPYVCAFFMSCGISISTVS